MPAQSDDSYINRRGLRVESGKSFTRRRTRIASSERVAMSTNNKEMRRFALLITFISTIALALSGCSAGGYGSDSAPKTSKFVIDKFNQGQFLDPFTAGSPEIGITLEAMTNLSALGYDKSKQQKAITWVVGNTDKLNSPGLVGSYIFTAHALGFSDDATVADLTTKLKAAISSDGTLKDSNNFAASWVIFALLASGENELANKVAVKLSTLSEVTGGYKYVQGDATSEEATDVTSFAIISMKATEGLGTSEDESAKSFAINKAKTWLQNSILESNHWLMGEDADVSGTAYAIMAMTALGEDASAEIKWLSAQANAKDGGITSPWSDGEGDVFSSAQSLLALSKLSLIDVLRHKVN
jgi:hypothetical protein